MLNAIVKKFKQLFQIKRQGIFYQYKIFNQKFSIPTSIGLTRLKCETDLLKNYIKFLDRCCINGNMFIYQCIGQNHISNNKYELEKIKNWYITRNFYLKCGYFPNIEKPKSFNEKLNWLKFHYNDPQQYECVDKYEFKKYIRKKIGDGYTANLYGLYNNASQIDFEKLPNQFVIKNTFGGYGTESSVIIVKDKKSENLDRIKFIMNDAIQDWWNGYFYDLSNIWHGHARIIAEEYLDQGNGQLYDYKFFCFYGDVKYFYIGADKFEDKRCISFFDINWNKIPVIYDSYPNIPFKVEPPICFEKMIEIASLLSKDFPFVRVDMYVIKNKIYIGELTFFPGSGFGKYSPSKFDYKFGEYIDITRVMSSPFYHK